MTITEAHYAFRLGFDRVDSQTNQDFRPEEIDFFFNQAQLEIIHEFYSPMSNPKRKGFEMDQKRIDDLSTIHIKFPAQAGLTPTLDTGVYEVDLSALSYPYLHYTAAWATATVNGCEKTLTLRPIQHDDYRDALADSFQGSDKDHLLFNFGRSSTTSSPSIYIYPSDSTTVVSTVFIEYLKRPAQVNLGSYTYLDGIVYPQQGFELPDHMHQRIVDRAIRNAALAVMDNQLQNKMLKTTLGD